MTQSKTARSAVATLQRLLLFIFMSTVAFASVYINTAFAGSIDISKSGTQATISAPVSTKYKTSQVGKALWNHGTFYVYFFEGTTSAKAVDVKEDGSDIKTKGAEVAYKDGVSWAKVHVAAVSSSTAGNGGKNARLKDNVGSNLYYADYLDSSQQFYVWISDSGGDGGKISLRSTESKTIYAGKKTYKNVEVITVSSQHGASHHDKGVSESPYYDVLNIPFKWSGKDEHQVPYKVLSSRGVGNNDNYNTFYRLAWRQYSNGTTYSGYSPYKLQHDTTNATNIWTSVNLASVGISLAPTYADESLKTPSDIQFRNQESFLACFLRIPKEQVLINTDGGTLQLGSKTYSGKTEAFKKASCATKLLLPSSGYKKGKDGSKKGYRLAGYAWTSGTNRAKKDSAAPKRNKPFNSFDQANPTSIDIDDAKINLCNKWQLPEFGSDNMDFENEGFLKAPSVAKTTFKALWKPMVFAIHYIINGQETSTVKVDYDAPYTLTKAPAGSSGWSVQYEDGTAASADGNMPAKDIYAYAQTDQPGAVRYYIDGKLSATFTVPFGTNPLLTTYKDKNSGGIEFDDNGVWSVNSATYTANYKEHYNVPYQVGCTHYVDTSHEVGWQIVKSGYWTTDKRGDKHWVDTSYLVAPHWERSGYWEHDYDMKDNYEPYVVKTYTQTGSVPSNPNGGTWLGWFTNAKCTAKAASSYTFRSGDCLSFYSYTTHKVTYKINGKTVREETLRFGETVNPYSNGQDLNPYGGKLKSWYTDENCTQKAAESITVGRGDITFYAYTNHTVHLWMDNGAKIASNDTYDPSDKEESGDSEDENSDSDDGSSDEDPDEQSYCRGELTVRYGESLVLPHDNAADTTLTRPGCESWLATNGSWYSDKNYTSKISAVICTGDATYYSFNNVKLSYDLSTYAKQLEAAHELLDSKNNKVLLTSFLPAAKLYRYGTTVSIEGDGAVHWTANGGYTRSAKSQKGGYLDQDATGKPSKALTLQRSLTVYKQWAQGIFDGIVTS